MSSRMIGDPLKFAVQYELDANSCGEWMNGRFCYWCAGRQVGGYDTATSLRDVLFAIENNIKWVTSRHSARFCAMSAGDAFRLLDGGLYRGLGPDWDGIPEQESWANHDVAALVLSGWRVFAVDCELTTRVIFSPEPCVDVHVVEVSLGEVSRVLQRVCEELQAIHDATQRTVRLSGAEAAYLTVRFVLPAPLAQIIDTAERTHDEGRVLKLYEGQAEHFRDEFTEHLARVGFGPDYEPTDEGRLLEDLIDRFAG